MHHLQGDAALQPEIRGDVHGCHAAAGDARSHPVAVVDKLPDQRVDLLAGAHGVILRLRCGHRRERNTRAITRVAGRYAVVNVPQARARHAAGTEQMSSLVS